MRKRKGPVTRHRFNRAAASGQAISVTTAKSGCSNCRPPHPAWKKAGPQFERWRYIAVAGGQHLGICFPETGHLGLQAATRGARGNRDGKTETGAASHPAPTDGARADSERWSPASVQRHLLLCGIGKGAGRIRRVGETDPLRIVVHLLHLLSPPLPAGGRKFDMRAAGIARQMMAAAVK